MGKNLLKTQPPNYISWSAAYFKCVADNRPLPVKSRLEAADGSNLTIGLLEIIIDQCGKTTGTTSLAILEKNWTDLGLHLNDIQEDPAMQLDIQYFIAASAMQIASKEDLV